jgi:predicted CXXCH cytochrome family protein
MGLPEFVRVHLPGRSAAGIALAGAAAALLLAAPMARADGGPHVASHNSGAGGLTTDSCAGCHRAHTARGASLLKSTSEVTLCLACHGAGSLGSTTDVSNGMDATTGRGLKGGGFTRTVMDTAWTGGAASRPTTSSHLADGTTAGTMWGNGAIGSGAGATGVVLTCTSCHDPHGNGNYRILRPIPVGSNTSAAVAIADDTTAKHYAVTSTQNRYFGEAYFATDTGPWIRQYQLDEWCAACHTRYDAVNVSVDGTGGPGHTNSGDSTFGYRHMTRFSFWFNCGTCHAGGGMGPARDPLGVGVLVAHEPTCQACHVAHGTSATMVANAGKVAWPSGATAPSGDQRSSLLRLDNRGVCQGCHDPTAN